MAFASDATQDLNHPTEGGVRITIRKLAHYQLSAAQDARGDAAASKAKLLGETIKYLPESSVEDRARMESDPANKYDRRTVLRYGVVGWSYARPCDDEAKDDLDEETAAWLFDKIIAFSVRSTAEVLASGAGSPHGRDQAPADGRGN